MLTEQVSSSVLHVCDTYTQERRLTQMELHLVWRFTLPLGTTAFNPEQENICNNWEQVGGAGMFSVLRFRMKRMCETGLYRVCLPENTQACD